MFSNFNNKELLTKLKNILNIYSNSAFGTAARIPIKGKWVVNPGMHNHNGDVLPVGSGFIRYPFRNTPGSGTESRLFWLPLATADGASGVPELDFVVPSCTGSPPARDVGSPCCALYDFGDPDPNGWRTRYCLKFIVELDHPKIPDINFGLPKIRPNGHPPRGIVGPIWVSCKASVLNGEHIIECTPLDPVNVVRSTPRPPRSRGPRTPPTDTGGGFRDGGGGFQGG